MNLQNQPESFTADLPTLTNDISYEIGIKLDPRVFAGDSIFTNLDVFEYVEAQKIFDKKKVNVTADKVMSIRTIIKELGDLNYTTTSRSLKGFKEKEEEEDKGNNDVY